MTVYQISNLKKNGIFLTSVIDILARAAFFGYWFFDNLLILAKLKLFKGDTTSLNKKCMLWWFFGNIFGLISSIRNIIQAKAQAAYYIKLIKDAPEKKDLFKDKFVALKNVRATAIRGILKSGFDGITAASGAGKCAFYYSFQLMLLFQVFGILQVSS